MAKRKQKISRDFNINSPPPSLPYPAVSVIIPLYNVEKYVGECLDSLLAQTFQNFEIIVVDDCSTDNSVAVVESYAEKFGGQLTLSRMKKNSGGAGFPRNKGMEFSRGEYIYFLDPDDAITPTALEELYTHAKKFDADVVQSEKWFEILDEFWNDADYRKKIKPTSWPTGEKIFITEPTLLSENLERRVVEFGKRWLTWSVCLQFVRRKFIVDNEIKFGDFICEDMTFTICELCSAGKYLVIPQTFYLYRVHDKSAIHSQQDLPKLFHRELKALKGGIKYLGEFLSDDKFFSSRPDLKYLLFDMFAQEICSHLVAIYAKVPAPALDEILRQEFVSDKALTSFIFNSMNVQRLQLVQAQARIAELEAQLKNK